MKRHYCTHCQRKRKENVMHIHSQSVCAKMSWACNDKIGCYAAAAEKRRGVQLNWVDELERICSPCTTSQLQPVYYSNLVARK